MLSTCDFNIASGKSTVAALMERFYDVTQGSITIDGVDIRDLDPTWLRGHAIGFINQVSYVCVFVHWFCLSSVFCFLCIMCAMPWSCWGQREWMGRQTDKHSGHHEQSTTRQGRNAEKLEELSEHRQTRALQHWSPEGNKGGERNSLGISLWGWGPPRWPSG